MLWTHVPTSIATPLPAGAACNEASFSVNSMSDARQGLGTQVNGLVQPRIVVPPGQVERWRMIHAGVTADMEMELLPAIGSDCSAWAGSGALAFHQVAADGISLPAVHTRSSLFLSPAYRADVMLETPSTEGLWCLVITRDGPPGVSVEVGLELQVDASAGAPVGAGLPTDAELASVSPPLLSCTGPADGYDTIVMNQEFDAAGNPCPDLNISCATMMTQPGPRQLSFGALDEWSLVAGQSEHPFHIHINPFVVCTSHPDEPPAPHWRDTWLVRGAGPTTIRQEYIDFTGGFMLHCHRSEHGDSGMMEMVEIVP